ncbi:hypothetical protein LXA43DRAFT_971752 [Ganoderma leucocontextum]|nr:hypothetical protein LXA43DRAFT_971752 [Ganoderma leucocontextum]
MDSLPLELHTQIFEFACTDDGATARALALVSRYVRDAASPFLFQSLSVSGLAQMEALVARLDTLPPHSRRIRHVFLADWAHKDTLKRGGAFPAMERYDQERALASRILEYASPTLETLAVVAACPYTAPPLVGHLFALPLPRLEELAIHGFYPFPQSHDNDGMPRLARLHLSGSRNPHGLLQLGALEAACPTLTHLRVSGIMGAASFARELYEAALPRPRSEHELDLKAETRLVKVEVVEGDGEDMFEVLRSDWLVRLEPQRQGQA